jgi:hypothetical protein
VSSALGRPNLAAAGFGRRVGSPRAREPGVLLDIDRTPPATMPPATALRRVGVSPLPLDMRGAVALCQERTKLGSANLDQRLLAPTWIAPAPPAP